MPTFARFRSTTFAFLALVSSIALAAPPASATDIDGDGFDDLLIGVPLEDEDGARDAGIVHVVSGRRLRNRIDLGAVLRQSRLGGQAHRRDAFGAAVELVDIDGDGHHEAIVGTPGETIDGIVRAGAVFVMPGSRAGVVVAAATMLVEGRDGLPGTPGRDHAFGWDLTSGDFDADGFGDVVISSVGAVVDGVGGAGSVIVIPGSAAGLDVGRAQLLSHAGTIAGVPSDDGSFGRSLTVGNFDGDDFDDLAVGVPGHDVRGRADAGAVNVIMGSIDGLTGARNRLVTQAGFGDQPETGDLFGFSLATTDMNCDGRDELAVGVPNEDVDDEPNAGAVVLIAGSPTGLIRRHHRFLTAGRAGIPGQPGNAGFGKALAGGNFDGDRCDDLAIGAPFATIGPNRAAGAVTVVSGHERRSRPPDARLLSRASGLPGAQQRRSFIGSAFAVGDFDGDGIDDLAVAAPGDRVGERRRAGSVTLVFGSSDGLGIGGAVMLDQRDHPRTQPDYGDQFGSSLQYAAS